MINVNMFPMEMTQRNKIVISGLAVIILVGIYILFDRQSKKDALEVGDTATTTNSTSTVNTGGTGNYTIEQVPLSNTKPSMIPIPDLNRKITVSAGAIVSPEASSLAQTQVATLQERLKKNSADFPAWIDLGISQKMGGDYEGAIISWTYASKIAPTDYISLANIGNLYAYYLKDNGQAEVYYKQAISRSSTVNYLYTQLAEIYRDVFMDLDKARAIVEQGLVKIPNDANLLQLKASLK